MGMAPSLQLRQSQSLVMTPQLQQAIKLLALSNLEIEAFIAEEVERNPLLAADQTDDRATPEPVEADPIAADATGGEAALDVDVAAERFDDGPSEAALSTGPTGSGAGGEELPDLDSLGAPPASLHDHLLTQAGTAIDGVD